jgi:Fe-S-cluster-containing dehydrogenase component
MDLRTGAVKADFEKCTGCGICVHVCPYGAASRDPETHKALICDLCDGDPECAKICPEGALLYLDPDDAAEYKRIAFSRLQKKEVTALKPDAR